MPAMDISTFPSCLSCTAGFYCPNRGMTAPISCGPGKFSGFGYSVCDQCPAGHFCPTAQNNTYANVMEFFVCDAGLYCPPGMSFVPEPLSSSCSPAYYCPRGTPEMVPCPSGTYNPRNGSSSIQDCLACPGGYWCSQNTSTFVNNLCAPGYYCPAGSKTPFSVPCPAGTYRSESFGKNESDCAECVEGYYCPPASKRGLVCPAGSYCPNGVGEPIKCPAGYFRSSVGGLALADCAYCEPGYFCDQPGLIQPSGLCQPGYFCTYGQYTSAPENGVCFAGHYCPEGTRSPVPCPPGTYNPLNGSKTTLDCLPCPPGKSCPTFGIVQPPEACSPGFYCTLASRSSSPSNSSNGGLCPAGTYCPAGAFKPKPCDPGFFAPVPALSSCQRCPAGFFCFNLSTILPQICPAGHYCPETSSSPIQCPPGSYSNLTGLRNISECIPCPKGKYCFRQGLHSPTGDCFAGHLCLQGAIFPNETVNASALFGQRLSFPCPPGYFCTTGTTAPTPCPPGTFCQGSNSQPDPCAAGTFNRNFTATSCSQCAAGYICSPGGVADYVAGTYYAAPSLYACANESGGAVAWTQETATNGTYVAGDVVTDVDGNAYVSGTVSRASEGVYEVVLTKYSTAGREVWTSVLSSESSPASAQGMAVASAGSLYVGINREGGWSVLKVSSCGQQEWRVDDADSLEDQARLGLAVGSDVVLVAWTNVSGSTTVRQYTMEGKLAWERVMIAGAAGAKVIATGLGADAAGGGFMVGMYEGQFAGQYAEGGWDGFLLRFDVDGQQGWNSTDNVSAAQDSCTVGIRRTISSPVSGASDVFVIRYGADGNTTWSKAIGTCGNDRPVGLAVDSFGGIYLLGQSPADASRGGPIGFSVKLSRGGDLLWKQTWGQSAESAGGGISVGSGLVIAAMDSYNSSSGSRYSNVTAYLSNPACYGLSEGGNFVCPPGHFCVEGLKSLAEGACPPGTYSNRSGLASFSECESCLPGMYCSEWGLTAPTGPCAAGFYCTSGAADPNASMCDPRSVSSVLTCATSLLYKECSPNLTCGGICPAGYFCPVGSPTPTACTPGYYCDKDGQGIVSGPCSSGYFCGYSSGGAGASTPTPDSADSRGPCPVGYYCPEGTVYPIPCPKGTFRPYLKGQANSSCLACTPGFYCPVQGLSNVSGYPCSGGFYCPGGQSTGTPSGYQCPVGHECPEGSKSPKTCPPAYYQNDVGQSACKVCEAGYYCTGSPDLNSGSGAVICPTGYYCPAGSAEKLSCSPGTYMPRTGESACWSCPAQSTCPEEGMSSPLPCPAGHYCPENNSLPVPCPEGSFSADQNLASAGECTACLPGKYCGTSGLRSPTGDCFAGHLCLQGAIFPNETVNASALFGQRLSFPCPPGYFCTTGTTAPTPCPPGTFCQGSNSQPDPCAAGTFNRNFTATSCSQCAAGYICSPGGVADYVAGTYYAAPSLYACANESGGAVAWTQETATNGTYVAGDVVTDVDGNAYVSGTVSRASEGVYEVVLTKYSTAGREVWTSVLSSESSPASAQGMAVASAGSLYVGINREGGWSVLKVSSCGQQEWRVDDADSLEDQARLGLAVGSDVVLVAWTNVSGSTTVRQYTMEGKLAWERVMIAGAAGAKVIATGLGADAAGGGFMVGMYEGQFAGQYAEGGWDGFLLRFGVDGQQVALEWRSRLAGWLCMVELGACRTAPITSVLPKNLTITTTSSLNENSSLSRIFLLKFDHEMVSQTQIFLGSNRNLHSKGITLDSFGGIYLLGQSPADASRGGPIGFSVKLSRGGDLLWKQTWGQSAESAGGGISVGSGLVIAAMDSYNSSSGSRYSNVTAYLSNPACYGLSEGGNFVCPPGHFCVEGLKSLAEGACPPGTYSNRSGLASFSECESCLPGMYCSEWGLTAPTGPCAAGFYCTSGAADPNASMCDPRSVSSVLTCATSLLYKECSPNLTCGGICPAGYFCPVGSPTPTACTPGYYCDKDGQGIVSGPCSSGYFCGYSSGGAGASTPTPDSADSRGPCPVGYYCPEGTVYPIPCPKGTFRPYLKGQANSSCLACTPGFYCPVQGLSNVSGYPCSGGFYCPGGQSTGTPSGYQCPVGHECPEGSKSPKTCPPAYYQNDVGQSACKVCEAGYYCTGSPDLNSGSGAVICPTGYYCPAGSAEKLSCSPGTYMPRTGESACWSCPAQSTCPEEGMSSPLPCPAGHYCPENNSLPVPCPEGSFSADQNLASAGECTACLPGKYCGTSGLRSLFLSIPWLSCRKRFALSGGKLLSCW
ncbi:hypothetical protein GUITHDRAFT_110175 [Guillardia theta CCMP2712]|uniref:TNFR-Cys domain-containing protein n=1 Tax=Guillardia theta (strain CCMP2712) TaxID=905079 RepID=L1J5D0_GUITC|nr:hypothetical protein GUITHDRAFT_110175 [Guillardia theta CCMP2712]EKX43721.1 hypothetical protein GUITHDRAFT_110175 [Guillardia theta CCMP2712]|eukprot:XP_005830701.1 hypothetical protein GUITHDRAFT_110175 [Guillardia theta CCMP2712]